MFFDAISTGHAGYTTLHSDKAENTIDRLITLMKRDPRAQMYKDEYLEKLLARTIDIIIYMKDFKIYEITKVSYDKDIVYKTLYKQETLNTPFGQEKIFREVNSI